MAIGYAMVNNLPHGEQGFTTIELKTNFIGKALKNDVR
jgi:acyl-coenzyme A thioesterase PaaI-like protein